ncbi:pyridoxamine 5'-phosphate oxidase family protein [Nocardioides sp. DS6]|uniref:Pyridoxamine 5'-phosphate oxidase family protein n=1 Tax=Nocardioides eburneus TaxID=3231482 RepID=A0ABV3T1C4_9ACTN
MSIPVDVADLAQTLTSFGSGYLLTVSPAGTVKVVTVDPVVEDGMLLVRGPGRGTLTNLAANPQVSLAFPPPQPHGFTLLVDGTGVAEGDDVRVQPSGAVLHRPAAHGDGPPAPVSAPATDCGNDCHPVAGPVAGPASGSVSG